MLRGCAVGSLGVERAGPSEVRESGVQRGRKRASGLSPIAAASSADLTATSHDSR